VIKKKIKLTPVYLVWLTFFDFLVSGLITSLTVLLLSFFVILNSDRVTLGNILIISIIIFCFSLFFRLKRRFTVIEYDSQILTLSTYLGVIKIPWKSIKEFNVKYKKSWWTGFNSAISFSPDSGSLQEFLEIITDSKTYQVCMALGPLRQPIGKSEARVEPFGVSAKGLVYELNGFIKATI